MLGVSVRLGLTAALFVFAASCTAEEPEPEPAKGGQSSTGGSETSGGVSAGGKTSVGGTQASSGGKKQTSAGGTTSSGAGGTKTYGGAKSSGGSKSNGGSTFDCENIQCFRAIECVEQCGGPVLSSGCCPCAEGTFDSISCSSDGSGGTDGAGGALGVAGSDALGEGGAAFTLADLNVSCTGERCPTGLTPRSYHDIAGAERCACVLPCTMPNAVDAACPEGARCAALIDGPGTVCIRDLRVTE